MKRETKSAFIIVLGVLLFLWVLTLLAAFGFTQGAEETRTGLIGDSFGALNALISIFGFAAIIYAIQKEHEDDEEDEKRHEANLKLQKEVLELQRGVLDAQRKQSEVEVISLNIRIIERDLEVLARANRERRELFQQWSDTFQSMRHGRGVSVNQWVASHLKDVKLYPFHSACLSINPDFDADGEAAEEVTKLFQAYQSRGSKEKGEAAADRRLIQQWYEKLDKVSNVQPMPRSGPQ